MTAMMDVVVKSSPIGSAEVEIDLGGLHGKLSLSVHYDGDRRRHVRLRHHPWDGNAKYMHRETLSDGLGDSITYLGREEPSVCGGDTEG